MKGHFIATHEGLIMNLLAVDTSTWTGGVAVLKQGTVVAEVQVTTRKTHATRLMSTIDSALTLADMDLKALDAFAVTIGPGSFTGLRIGVSAVKGLAFATGKPVTGVSTLEVLVSQFPGFSDVICPMLDARKGQIFTALYQWDAHGKRQRLTDECAVEPEAWLERISRPCLFVGDGSVIYREVIEKTIGPLARFAPPYLQGLRPSVVAHLGSEQIERGNTVDVALLAPHYIRKSDAEIKREAGRLNESRPGVSSDE
jgi:tRNA threonylcarbamoyladenosine biosynthesis protein TsaB